MPAHRSHSVLLGSLADAVRAVARRLQNLRAAIGLVLLAGVLVAAAGIVAFAWVAVHVRAGRTQAFDDAVLLALGRHRIPWLEAAMLETTFLGTGTVVLMVTGVAALFLGLTRHRASAALLLAATIGSLVLNNVLKAVFDRPRPQLFTWGTRAVTTSFPSGHAMSAAAVYATVAYLAARLERRRGARVATYLAAAVLIAAISFSRLYLGVHYPSDVAAGVVVGLAWAAFCMAVLEAVQLYVRRPQGARRGAPHETRADPRVGAPADPALTDQLPEATTRSNSRS